MPCGVLAAVELHTTSQQRVGQQEEPGTSRVGLVVQHPPFDGAIVQCAEIDIVIAVGIRVAGDSVRSNLNRLARVDAILPVCRDRRIGCGHGEGGACAGSVGEAASV